MVRVLAAMEMEGIRIDPEVLRKLRGDGNSRGQSQASGELQCLLHRGRDAVVAEVRLGAQGSGGAARVVAVLLPQRRLAGSELGSVHGGIVLPGPGRWASPPGDRRAPRRTRVDPMGTPSAMARVGATRGESFGPPCDGGTATAVIRRHGRGAVHLLASGHGHT